jgi:hypothetical protein
VVVKRLIQRGRTSAGRDAGRIVARSKGRKAERCNFSSWFFKAAEDTWASVYQINDTASNHPIILFLQLSLTAKNGLPVLVVLDSLSSALSSSQPLLNMRE